MIEELAFELAEKYTSGDLEKLIKLIDLLVNGKKAVEAREAPVKPAPVVAASKPKGAKAVTPDPSEEEDAF